MTETLLLKLNKQQEEIIKAVLYFDVFNYPLTLEELYENSAISLSWTDFQQALKDLIDQGCLKTEGDFVLSAEADIATIDRRLKANNKALEVMPLAYRYSQKIASYPFVEGVCISGSLSKNYFDENSDLDFFIITKPNRLWICRTLLILRYKTLSKEKKKWWCTNYFIASDNLGIPDKNAFTGTELAYLFPTVNHQVYTRLLEHNAWYKNRFPNKHAASPKVSLPIRQPFYKTILESLFVSRFGDWMDNLLLGFTLRHWQKKYPDMAETDFELQFRSRKNVCKRHTKGFQNKILTLWEQKQKHFETKFNTLFQS